MAEFTIETTYHLPVYRQHAYDAETIEQACALAVADDDWSDDKQDFDSSGETFVSGMWEGPDAAYRGTALPVPAQFAEPSERKAQHFEVLLGVLKILAHVEYLTGIELAYWIPQVRTAITKAEAILAGEPDPQGEAAEGSSRVHALAWLEETRVAEQIVSIIETDPTVTELAAGEIAEADIHAACLAVAAGTDLSEERGAAEFRAALTAIRNAERRFATSP
jgi:hypothetical protein